MHGLRRQALASRMWGLLVEGTTEVISCRARVTPVVPFFVGFDQESAGSPKVTLSPGRRGNRAWALLPFLARKGEFDHEDQWTYKIHVSDGRSGRDVGHSTRCGSLRCAAVTLPHN